MTADHAAFMALGEGFLKLGGGDNALLPAVFKALGEDVQTVGGDFNKLAADFVTFDKALMGGGGGAGMPIGTALMTMFQDFHTLSTDTGMVAHDAAVLVSDLVQQSLAPNANHPNDHAGH
jgi:hypothetical protein